MRGKKKMLIYIIGLVIIISATPVFADSVFQTIDVLSNNISLFVNNEAVIVDNFLYNGTTYVPLRAVAEMTDMDVIWDGENKKIDLISNESFNMKTTDGKYNITGVNPKPLTDGNYLKWQYLSIVFDSNTKKITDNNKVVLLDYKGNRIDVKCQPGVTAKDNFIIITEKELELDTNYSLYIPKNSIVMENGDAYGEDILIYFKTATNVIKGKISSSKTFAGSTVILSANNEENGFSTMVVGDNEFYFSNIPQGNYELIIDKKSFGNIAVESNKVNSVKAIE